MHLGTNAEGKMVSITSTIVNLDLSSYVTWTRIHVSLSDLIRILGYGIFSKKNKSLHEYNLLFLKLINKTAHYNSKHAVAA